MKDLEIEIKVQIENDKNLLTFLEEKADFQYEKKQIDEYFSPEHNDYLAKRPVSEWLRLRDAEGEHSITYKHFHYDSNGLPTHADEHETGIGEIKDAKKILHALDFRSAAIVDKVRKVWMYEDFEIALDSVKGLGEFVEIEYKGDGEGKTVDGILQEMIKFLKDINCGEIKRDYRGYPF